MNFLLLLLVFVLIESALFLIVRLQRRSFSWLITKNDDVPTMDSKALKKFIDNSFDSNLGWVRKPNTSGVENGQKGQVAYNIDSIGSRTNTFNKTPAVIAAFGDSYVFCRQVEDDETWEAKLSQQEDIGVLNFGVGNYGVDQALLRYESTALSNTVKVVIMGFVPETICRVQSYWKHYLEFGNTFAFKPRFMLNQEGQLILLKNLVRCEDDFSCFQEKLPEIREADGFYEKKFRSQQFRFPYILSLMRNPLKQSMLISAVAIRAVSRALGITSHGIENLPFTLVMKNNLRDSYQQYRDARATKLLSSIMLRFKKEAQRRGHIPLVVIMPQLLDLKMNKNNVAPYQGYFNKLGRQVSVLDLTEKFINTEFEKLYIDDQYGGHLSAEGNQLVSNEIANWLKLKLKSKL